MPEPKVHELFEPVTGSWQYVVADPTSSSAVIIDPVLNYDAAKGVISTQSADELIKIVTDKGYKVEMILETHIHADHITAASYIQATLAKDQDYKPLVGIGGRIRNTQKMFGERYGIAASEYENVFDRMWEDDEAFSIGSLTVRAIHLPGHTPDHMGYKIGGNVFVGDSIFHVDIGSARADFPGGSAEAVYNSGRKLLALPDETKVWVGHDYPPDGRRAPVPFVTVKQHREENKHLKDGTHEAEFVETRRKRDATLAAPRLIHPSLQMNIRGGRLPAPTASGLRMVHLPLQVPDSPW
ncbi:beta-lactamase-like protein [Emericellopsis atlantica]|uniref:Beta-lactamase-like protein n=1 Tax=Emericellopsis atlantica TaxID=2614577 RepID=A0A9P7ZGJ9_9HYPO|nr:beta-lactamase-like protein [Emericellopsis atlantica]KAG9251620.1 beta-lactamase-like protein [Emericellopsis atlantica]